MQLTFQSCTRGTSHVDLNKEEGDKIMRKYYDDSVLNEEINNEQSEINIQSNNVNNSNDDTKGKDVDSAEIVEARNNSNTRASSNEVRISSSRVVNNSISSDSSNSDWDNNVSRQSHRRNNIQTEQSNERNRPVLRSRGRRRR